MKMSTRYSDNIVKKHHNVVDKVLNLAGLPHLDSKRTFKTDK